MFQAAGKPAAILALLIGAFGLAACGESSSEKATKQVCSATSEISAQIKKLENLPISSNFPSEASASVEAIGKSIKKIEEAVERIDQGVFGICDKCGLEIDIRRLEARPVTTMCIECKMLQEEEEKLREG